MSKSAEKTRRIVLLLLVIYAALLAIGFWVYPRPATAVAPRANWPYPELKVL